MSKTLAEIVVAGSAIYHILMGLACWLGVERVAKLTSFFYKVNLPQDKNMSYAIKPIGAFAVWTGYICAMAFHTGGEFFYYTCWGLVGLFLARAYFRWAGRELFFQNYGVSWQRSRWNVVFNTVLSAMLGMYLLSVGSA